jgi:hypothetical protein
MSTETQLSLHEHRERLELRANVIRSRLLRTIDALDTRRHQVKEIGARVKRLAAPAAAIVAGALVLTAVGAFALSRVVRARREKRLSYRAGAFVKRMSQPPRPSIPEDAVRRVVVVVLGIVAGELAKRATKSLIDGRMPESHALLPRGAT